MGRAVAGGTVERRPAECEPWLARAFGVDLELHFEAPALRHGEQPAAAAPTVLELVYASSLDAAWRPDEAKRLGGMVDPNGRVLIDIHEHPTLGIMLKAGRSGRYLIRPDARRVECSPPAVAGWYWQRMLVGQVLPLVAALRGLHVIHASAVAIGDHAIAMAGAPGAGKSTLAVEFVLSGHSLLAEDVLALRLEGDHVLAEPGVSLVNLRPSERAEEAVAAVARPVLGRSHKIHLDLPRAPGPLPLSALYLLEPAEAGSPLLEPLPAPTLPDLMGIPFVPYLARDEDLLRHLELGAGIAQTVDVVRVGVDRSMPAATLAAEIEHHAQSAWRRSSAGA